MGIVILAALAAAAVASPPADPAAATLIARPNWSAAPSFDDVARAYPAAAHGETGEVALDCKVNPQGRLGPCITRGETPLALDFDSEARTLIGKFHLTVDPAQAASAWVQLKFHMPDPTGDEFKARRVSQPIWIAGPDPDQVVKLYPPEAAAKGVATGLGVARCAVAADGVLHDCEALPGDPEGLGFSEAAVVFARAMQMSRWTAAGGPVDGATVKLPIRLKLAPKTK